MVDGDDDEAVRRQCCTEPGEFGCHAAVAVGQQNEWTPGPCRRRRIARGAAGADERNDCWPDPLRFLARVEGGRVPDHRAERVRAGAAPIVGLGRDEIARGDAGLEDSVGLRNIEHCEEDQRERQQPHPTGSGWPKWSHRLTPK